MSLLTVREALERRAPPAREPPRSAHPEAQNGRAESLNASLRTEGRGRAPPVAQRPREARAELPDLDPGVLQPHRLREGRNRLRPLAASPTWPASGRRQLGLQAERRAGRDAGRPAPRRGQDRPADELLAAALSAVRRRRTGDLAQAPITRRERPDGPRACARRRYDPPATTSAGTARRLPGRPSGTDHPVRRGSSR